MAKSPPAAARLANRIQQHLEQLPQAEKRLADLILASPGHLASYSASELTKMAGVSNATMTRFVQRIGYQTYDEMRRVARQGIDWGSPLYLMDRPAAKSAPSGTFEEHAAVSTENIRTTLANLSADTVSAVSEKIAGARQIRIYGQRNNFFFASYLRWQFIQFRSGVYVLPVSGETLAEYLVGLKPDDIFIVFGLRRRTPMLGTLIAAVKKLGVQVLLITDSANRSDLGADWVIKCDTRSEMPLDNHAAVMVLCHVLSAKLIEKVGTGGRQRLAAVEELHQVLKEL